MFRTVPLSIFRSFSLYTQKWYISYRFADSLQAGSGFHLDPRHNPSGLNMALGLTQPLTEMSYQKYFLGGKGGQCIGLATLPPVCAHCLEIHPDPARKLSANQYDIYHCCVYSEKLLKMETGTVRNM